MCVECKQMNFAPRNQPQKFMFKKVFSSLAVLLFWVASFAQGQSVAISGTIKTADGAPAELITVTLKHTKYQTTTDGSGNFTMSAPAGDYTLVVSSIAAHSKEFPITIKASTTNHFPDLTIIERASELEQVVVTGQFFEQSMSRSVYKVRAISAKQIEQKAPSSVESLLNTEIGVRISNDMALGETDFEVMGMSGNNVKVLVDGIPIVDRLTKKQSLSQIDVNTIERVEIVEGPMSVAYGTDALAGVINIITKKGKSNGQSKLSIGARVQEETLGREYNPFNGKGNHVQSVNGQYNFSNGIYAGANFTRNDFGGWQGENEGRKKEWPSKIQSLAGIQLGINKKSYDLLYKLDYLDETILIKGDVPQNHKATDVEFTAKRYTHQLQGNWRANQRLKLSLSASYQDYQRDKYSSVVNFSTGQTSPSTGEDAQDESNYSVLFGRATATWRVSTNLSIQGGIEYQRNEGQGDKIAIGHTSIDNAAVFVAVEYSPLDWLDLRPGVRSSYNSEYDAPIAIPSLNAKFKLTEKMDIRASYGRGFRAPTLQELYYTFYHVNGGGFWIKGNPDLKAEQSNSYMTSWVWRPIHGGNIRLTTSVSGFFNDFKDRIQMVLSADEASTQTYYNTGKYQTLGLSLENTLVWQKLSATVNFSYIGRYNSMKDDADFAAESQDRFRYSPELSLSLTYDWAKVATLNLFYKFTGARREYREVDSKLVLAGLDSYHWADLTASRPINKYVSINAGVKNLLDITRVENSIISSGSGHTNDLTSSLMGCGRSYFVGLTFKFNK